MTWNWTLCLVFLHHFAPETLFMWNIFFPTAWFCCTESQKVLDRLAEQGIYLDFVSAEVAEWHSLSSLPFFFFFSVCQTRLPPTVSHHFLSVYWLCAFSQIKLTSLFQPPTACKHSPQVLSSSTVLKWAAHHKVTFLSFFLPQNALIGNLQVNQSLKKVCPDSAVLIESNKLLFSVPGQLEEQALLHLCLIVLQEKTNRGISEPNDSNRCLM